MSEMVKHKTINLTKGYVSLSEHTLQDKEILISISRDEISVSYHLSKADFEKLLTEMDNF